MARVAWFISVIVAISFGRDAAYKTNTASISSSLEEDMAVIPLPKLQQNKTIETTTSAVTTLMTTISPLRTSSYNDYSNLQNINMRNTSLITKNASNELVPNVATLISVDNMTEAHKKIDTENNTQNNSFATKSTTENNPSYNDIKFAKWYLFKMRHNNSKELPKTPHRPLNVRIEYVHSTTKESMYVPMVRHNISQDNVFTNEIDTTELMAKRENNKNTPAHQKYIETTSTEVKKPFYSPLTLNNNLTHTDEQKSESKTSIQNCTHVADVKDTLLNIVNVINRNYTKKAHNNRKLNILKHLRTFFKKIWNKKKHVPQTNKVYDLGPEEDHTMQIICENFGPCKIKKENTLILKLKLKRLNQEIEAILKSISDIKSLLHILELPENSSHKSRSFQNDVEKYSSVVKGTYNFYNNVTLTENQLTKINDIKINTQIFLKSLRNFAQCLKDILKIMTLDPNNDKTHAKENMIEKSSHEKLKALLKKYILVQNSFMKRMYHLINQSDSSFGKGTPTERVNTQVSVGDNNNDIVIQRQSKKILENLKRLKNLAQALNSKRVKREATVFGDNTFEYFLMLMQYIIMKKYRNPFALAPANDGIDFLIDGIRNAPDIKLIRNKVSKINMMSPVTITLSDEDSSKDMDSDSPINRVFSKEDSKPIASILEHENVNTETYTTDAVYNRIFDSDIADPNNDIIYDNVTSPTKKRSGEEVDNIGFDKFGSSNNDLKKSENAVYTEEETAPVMSVASVIDLPVTKDSIESTSTTNVPETKSTNISSSESEDSLSGDKTSKIVSIEDNNFDKDNVIREIKLVNITDSTTSPSPVMSETSSEKSIAHNNIKAYMASSDEDPKKKSVESPEDVMNKKQMTFLHSLDYGTDKPEFEDMGAKEDSGSEDVELPSYFG